MDEVTAVVEVHMSFVVSVSVGPRSALSGDEFKQVLLEHVKGQIDAGGLMPEHIDGHTIVELRNTDTDEVLIGA